MFFIACIDAMAKSEVVFLLWLNSLELQVCSHMPLVLAYTVRVRCAFLADDDCAASTGQSQTRPRAPLMARARARAPWQPLPAGDAFAWRCFPCASLVVSRTFTRHLSCDVMTLAMPCMSNTPALVQLQDIYCSCARAHARMHARGLCP